MLILIFIVVDEVRPDGQMPRDNTVKGGDD